MIAGLPTDYVAVAPWADRSISYSIVPDGTDWGGPPSDLDATLTAEVGPDWRNVIAAAFAAWQSSANLSLSPVADGGLPDGTAGRAQGDPRFGDIRIGGRDLASTTVLATTALPWQYGTTGGDITLNTAQHWDRQTLYSVALHEIGHAIGLDHAKDPGDVMYPVLQYQTQLGEGDVAGAKALYPAAAPATTMHSPKWLRHQLHKHKGRH